MNTEIEATGRTYEEAIENACAKLGVTPDDVDYEVLERPRTALFGLKHIPAKVRVYIKEELADKFTVKPVVEEKSTPAPAPKKVEKPAPEKKVEKAPSEKKIEAKPPIKASEEKECPKPGKCETPLPPKKEERKPIAPELMQEKIKAASQYVREILDAMGHSDAVIEESEKDGIIVLRLTGENLGSVVGRRGDNLDAMQYLASLAANKTEGGYCRVILDVDEYRAKREASLSAYARKMAHQAVKSKRSITLEPMNPYERRIVHSAVQDVMGATSRSVGSEPARRVVISATEGASNRGRGDGDFKRDRRKRESKKVILPKNDEPPKCDDAGISLYGKIEL